MHQTLWTVFRAWWKSRHGYDALASCYALTRSARIRAATEDLPRINRCSGTDSAGRRCGSFVQRPGEKCFRCDPAVLVREREARVARVEREKVTPFRRVAR